MSVIVKGMDMPRNCANCYLERGGICTQTDLHMSMSWDSRLDGCPLVELPEKHGRLIDENDVIDAVHERLRVLQSDKAFVKKHGDIDLLGVLPYIAKIPTVIEAEGED